MTDIEMYLSHPDSVRSARHFAREVLAESGVPEQRRELAELLVSELASNAVKHTATNFTLAIEVKDSTIRIEVTDTGSGQPTLKHPEPDQPNGRGLLIVDNMADDWGTTVDGSTKTVWCILSARLPANSDH